MAVSPDVVAAIVREAQKAGWKDPAAFLAIALEESGGNPRAHNTSGEDSVGLFQLNRDGGAGTGYTVAQLMNPALNAHIAATGGARVGAHKLTGESAISTYFEGFGRGADNARSTQIAMSRYNEAKILIAGASGEIAAGGLIPGLGDVPILPGAGGSLSPGSKGIAPGFLTDIFGDVAKGLLRVAMVIGGAILVFLGVKGLLKNF